MPERKSLAVELKTDGDPGSLVAVFSTFNVKDHDGDVVVPGAFPEGKQVPIGQWNHGRDLPPIGIGTISSDEKAARLTGHLFLEATHAKDHYAALKGLGGLAEWSYIFEVTEQRDGELDGQKVRFLEKLDPWRVDPVDRGASIGTFTESVKSAPTTYAEHAEHVLADVQALLKRTGELASLRAKDGRTLSDAHRDRMTSLLAGLEQASADIKGLCEAKADEPIDYGRLMRAQLDLQRVRMAALQGA